MMNRNQSPRRGSTRRIVIPFLVCLLIAAWNIALYPQYLTARDAILFDRSKVENSIAVTKFDSSKVENSSAVTKSCEYSKKEEEWECSACYHNECQRLKPRGACPKLTAPRKDEWDDPPRSMSEYATDFEYNDERVQRLIPLRTLSWRHHRYYSQPMCTVRQCFDLTKCSSDKLTVYMNITSKTLLDEIISENSTTVQRVEDWREACLIVVLPGIYKSAEELQKSGHFRHSLGKNHLFWRTKDWNFDKMLTPDSPIESFNTGYAALATEALTMTHIRLGYDLTLALPRRWGRSSKSVDIHRPRKWLLTFRGAIKNTVHKYYHHRWLAAEYWHNEKDVLVDVVCKESNRGAIYKQYEYSQSLYDDMMWNSTFAFTPGGSGVGSYRFGEALSTGSIPVIVGDDFAPPLSPEIDWSTCIVYVSEKNIVDLPRYLREMNVDEVRSRQKECWRLFQKVIGDKLEKSEDGSSIVYKHDEKTTLKLALEIWAHRVSMAIRSTEIFDTT